MTNDATPPSSHKEPSSFSEQETLQTETDLPETWLIGSGQVVDKYWFRAQDRGQVNIAGIISKEDESSFRQKHPNYNGIYKQTHSDDETIEFLAGVVPQDKESRIAIVTTADARVPLTIKFLEDERFNNTKLFIEKPYSSKLEDIQTYKDLILRYPDRLHFSAKYAEGRGDILYHHLPLYRVPKYIKARLIEGWNYTKVVTDRVRKDGSHPFLDDGAEWDIGFHQFTVIAKAAERFGGFSHFAIGKTSDLSKKRPDFEPKYGFGAQIFLITKTGFAIPIYIEVGKGNGQNERFVDFAYRYTDRQFNIDCNIRQFFTTKDATDNVWLVRGDKFFEMDRHKKNHDYYSVELGSDKFDQTLEEQEKLLKIAEFCFALKELRLSQNN